MVDSPDADLMAALAEHDLISGDLIAKLCSASELVKDLPDQNGDDDWAMFTQAWGEVQQHSYETIRNAIFMHASIELLDSPLFEILFECGPYVRPPTTFHSTQMDVETKMPMRCSVEFTAKAFVEECIKINADFATCTQWGEYPEFWRMASSLERAGINVLDFLSTEVSDELCTRCPLLQVLINTLSATQGQVVLREAHLRRVFHHLHARQGFQHKGSTMHIPPYPAPESATALDFNHAHFVAWLQAAEVDMLAFDWPNIYDVESLDILHKRIHQMNARNVLVKDFMAGREPPPGTPGATIYQYILSACTPLVHCHLFWANIISSGHGAAFIHVQMAHGVQRDAQEPTTLMAPSQAVAFVDTLEKGNLADIPKEDMRCSHCWSDFDDDADDEGVDNSPVQLPCHRRHRIGRDCLIEILCKTGPLCPLCRVDIVELGGAASGHGV
ncbi:hypothetical protein ACEQ8H_004480 [Pleosporales sp. CAS-2024a]